MKKQMFTAALVLAAAVSAQASKARLSALGNSEHIVDIQEIFSQEPDQALNYEAATVEFGGNSGASVEAEGGFVRKVDDSAWSLYLGKSSTTYLAFVKTATDGVATNSNLITGLQGAPFNLSQDDAEERARALADALFAGHAQSNPLQLTYAKKSGDINWGVGAFYVGNDYKANKSFSATSTASSFTETYTGKVKQTIAGVLVGANNGVWDAQLRLGLAGETETTIGAVSGLTAANAFFNPGDKLEVNSTGSVKASGGYLMDTMYFYGGVEVGSGEVKNNGTKLADGNNSTVTVGVVNSHKKDGVDFFYGASAVISTVEDDVANSKTESTLIPLLVGVEADVTDWLTVRGSFIQPLGLLSSSKAKGSSSTSVDDNSVTALGAGFKVGKATIDAVISTGTTGEFGFNGTDGDIFGQASVTYNF